MKKLQGTSSKTTKDIKVTVITEYDVKNSCPSECRYVFCYNISIENKRFEPIRLLKRKWHIFDFGFGFTEVAGDGVIGLVPEIKPGENFGYFSNVILRSGLGTMCGTYLIQNTITEEVFEVEISKFNLFSTVLSN